MKREIEFRIWNGEEMDYNPKLGVPSTTSLNVWLCIYAGGEVMQFTGIEDKNGNDIYEGDIVKCFDYSALDGEWNLDKVHVGVIEWTAPCFSLKIPGKKTLDTPCIKLFEDDVYLDYWCNAENLEVIGNIYESPELINKQ